MFQPVFYSEFVMARSASETWGSERAAASRGLAMREGCSQLGSLRMPPTAEI